MSKILRGVLGILLIWPGVYMISIIPGTFTSGEINPELIDSLVDKISWGMLMLGCSGIFFVLGVTIIKNLNLYKIKNYFIFFMIMFIIGIYYSFMFQSPW